MAKIVQLDLFTAVAMPAPALRSFEKAMPASINQSSTLPNYREYFYFDDFYAAAQRAGIIGVLPKSDWCSGCRLACACDRDMCSRDLR